MSEKRGTSSQHSAESGPCKECQRRWRWHASTHVAHCFIQETMCAPRFTLGNIDTPPATSSPLYICIYASAQISALCCCRWAAEAGLRFVERVSMPANNFTLVFQRGG